MSTYINKQILSLTREVYMSPAQSTPKTLSAYNKLMKSKTLEDYASNLKLLRSALGAYKPSNRDVLAK